MNFQSYVNKAPTRFFPLETYLETIVIIGKVSSFRKRGISDDLT